jgi:hypothetical protein
MPPRGNHWRSRVGCKTSRGVLPRAAGGCTATVALRLAASVGLRSAGAEPAGQHPMAPVVTPVLLEQWRRDGFFVLRGVVDGETVAELRGVLKNMMLTPDPSAAGARVDPEPQQPPETASSQGRMARFRKFNGVAQTFFPLMWHECVAGVWADVAAEMAPHLGGGDDGDVLLKFSSSFMKQPGGGAATPWHQDNGLWRDGNTDCFSVWMALDHTTKENGEHCSSVIPTCFLSSLLDHTTHGCNARTQDACSSSQAR